MVLGLVASLAGTSFGQGAWGDREWHEDPEHEAEQWESTISPREYLEALDATGMQRAKQSASTSTSSWTRLGPIGGYGPRLTFNGRVAGIRTIPDGGGGYRIFLGASGGGVWRSHSSAPSVYTQIAPTLLNPSVRALAIDPADDSRIVVFTGDPGRYEGAGVYYTTNSGATWSAGSLSVIPKRAYRLEYVNGSSTELVAATSAGIFRSTDAAVSWQRVWTGDATGLRLHPTSADTMYAVTKDVGLLRSTNRGASWGPVPGASGLPPAASWGRATLAICRGTPAAMAVFIATPRGYLLGVWRTTNTGVTWTNATGDLPDLARTQADHAQAIAIKPDDPEHMYVGSIELFRTTDGGAHWVMHSQSSGFDIGHGDVTQLYFSPEAGDNLLWICNDGGIFRHDIGAMTTIGLNGNGTTGLNLAQVDHLEWRRSLGIINLQDNATLATQNTGANWSYVPVGNDKGGDGSAMQITDAEAHEYWFWLGSNPFHLYRVTASGTLEFMQEPAGATSALFYDPFGGRLYVPVGSDIWSIAKNASPGAYSLEAVPPLHSQSYGLQGLFGSKADGRTFFVNFRDNLERDVAVARWTGSTWTVHTTTDLAPSGGKVWVIAPSSESPGEAWAGCRAPVGSSKVFHTTDYGATWDDVTGELSSVGAVWCLAPTPFDPSTIYAGTDIGIFRTTDAGKSWQPFQDGMPIVQCKDLKFVVDPTTGGQHRLMAATYGLGVWTRDVPSRPIVYVDKTYVGTEDGSIEHPYNTLTEGVDAAPGGAVVALRSNTYFEPQTLSKNLLLVSWAGPSLVD